MYAGIVQTVQSLHLPTVSKHTLRGLKKMRIMNAAECGLTGFRGWAKIIRTDLQVSGGERSSTVWHVIGVCPRVLRRQFTFAPSRRCRLCPYLSCHRQKTLDHNCVARKLPSVGAGKVHLNKSSFLVSLKGTNSNFLWNVQKLHNKRPDWWRRPLPRHHSGLGFQELQEEFVHGHTAVLFDAAEVLDCPSRCLT